MEINILYEDKDIAVVNKPASLVVHSDGRTKEPTLTEWIEKKFPKAKGVGESLGGIERSGIVHRLDRETSGVIAIAKTKEGYDCLKKQFQNREVGKRYLAFVYGEMKEDFGTIDRPIGKSPSDFRKWSATRGAKGKMREAETWWTLIYSNKDYSLVEVEPKTGRTHQIRVHMKAINHPVVADKLYASGKPEFLGFKRTALHAYFLSFKNCSGKIVEAKAPLPSDFKKAISKLPEAKEFAKNKGI